MMAASARDEDAELIAAAMSACDEVTSRARRDLAAVNTFTRAMYAKIAADADAAHQRVLDIVKAARKRKAELEEQLSALGRDLAEVKPSTDVSQAEWEKGLLPPPTPYLVASCLYALRREQEARSSV